MEDESCWQPKEERSKGLNECITICIEGNLASGKSLLLDKAVDLFPTIVQVVQEPVDLWRDVCGGNLYELGITEPRRWGCTFQTYAMVTMLQSHQVEMLRPIRVIERSVHSARYCFAEKLYNDGHISAMELGVLDSLFQGVKTQCHVNHFVYLRTSPQLCMERMKLRQRSEEDAVPLEYFKEIESYHDNWLLLNNLGTMHAPVSVINGGQTPDAVMKELAVIIRQISFQF